jgi:hypothetical protein
LRSDNVNLSGETAGTGGISEIWAHRDPDGSLSFIISGELKDPLDRDSPSTPNFNRRLPSGGEIRLPRYDIAHLWGPGFGDEAFDGMMYAPQEVNRVLQRHGIESRLYELRALARTRGATIQVRAQATSYPLRTWRGHQMLKSAHYHFEVRYPDGTREVIGEVDIQVPRPSSSGQPSIDVTGGSAQVWSLP